MTLGVSRSGQRITISGNTNVSLDVGLNTAGANHGAVRLVMENGYANHVRITEDAQHIRSFWSQLGKLLDEAEEERQAIAAEHGEAGPVTTTPEYKG